MQINVTVSDPELIAAIKAWEDGSEYVLTITQDAPMQFTATAAGEAPEAEPETPAETSAEPGEESMPMRKAPGIAMMMAKGKK